MNVTFKNLNAEISRKNRHLFKPLFFMQKQGFFISTAGPGVVSLAQAILETKEEVYFRDGNELNYRESNLTLDPDECELPEGTKPHDPAWDWMKVYCENTPNYKKSWDVDYRQHHARSYKQKND